MKVDILKEIVENARPKLDSYKNCGPINQKIKSELQNQGIKSEYVEGRLTKYGLRGNGPEHGFVIVVDEKLVDSEPIIVDGAIRQFCDERKECGEIFFSLGERKSLPQCAVLKPSNELYDHYLY